MLWIHSTKYLILSGLEKYTQDKVDKKDNKENENRNNTNLREDVIIFKSYTFGVDHV